MKQNQEAMMRLHSLYIDHTKHKGRGVFTNEILEPDTVIEIAPVIVMTGEERKLLDATLLHDYIFEWGKDRKQCAMALGWVPVYNHSSAANCEYFMDFDEQAMFLKTIKKVNEREELTINYNGDYDDTRPVWFEIKK